jgi:tetratricopeptide (TPR) repeat protein
MSWHAAPASRMGHKPAIAYGPSPNRAPAQSDLDTYRRIRDAYRRGDETAIATLLEWDRGDTQHIIALVNRSPDTPWTASDITAVALLHTAAAIRLLNEGREETAVLHLDAAGRILQRGGPDVGAFASRWYVAIARLLRDQLRGESALNVLRLGRERLRDDPAVLCESGELAELLAAQAIEPVRRDLATTLSLRLAKNLVDTMSKRRTDQLDDAARWLRRSVERAPSNPEAQLHLGRVLMLQGEDAAALTALTSISPSAVPATRYLASMYIGAVHERKGALEPAVDAYRRAVDILPASQAAYIALSEVLQRAGRGEESRVVLDAMLSRSPEPDDPWWFYFFETKSAVNARVSALFSEVGR